MVRIKQYLLSVFISALVVSILSLFQDKKTGLGAAIRIICAIFLIISFLFPIPGLDIESASRYFQSFSAESIDVSAFGVKLNQNAKREIIKQNTEAYIQDKAFLLGADLEVTIFLSEDEQMIPNSVEIRGMIANGTKLQLQSLIAKDLGIEKEHQRWIH